MRAATGHGQCVDAHFERASDAGVDFDFPPTTLSWGARHSYVADPDGHTISFVQPRRALEGLASITNGRNRSAQSSITSASRLRDWSNAMAGYWALRAAGREPRIDRVVSWPPVYDWTERTSWAAR